MHLRCVDCQTGHYTAATRPLGRFARALACSECGGRLVVEPEHEQPPVDEHAGGLRLAERVEASAAR